LDAGAAGGRAWAAGVATRQTTVVSVATERRPLGSSTKCRFPTTPVHCYYLGRLGHDRFRRLDLFLRSQLGLTLRPPGMSYYFIVGGGLVGALAMIASTLPLLDRSLDLRT